MWGDPHIVTLDGVKYTYNPLGCVHLIYSKDLKMQAKTDYAVNIVGERVNATVFTQFAVYEKTSGTVIVNLNAKKTGLN